MEMIETHKKRRGKRKKMFGDFRGHRSSVCRYISISPSSIQSAHINGRRMYVIPKMSPLRDKAGSAPTPPTHPSPSVSHHILYACAHVYHQYSPSTKKVGIGCRQHGRRPFQQHQSRSLSASVSLISPTRRRRGAKSDLTHV